MRSSRESSDSRDGRYRDSRRDDRDRRQSSAISPSIKRLKTSKDSQTSTSNSSQSSNKSQSTQRDKQLSNEPKFDCLKTSLDAMKAEEEEAINGTTSEEIVEEFGLKCNAIRDICKQILEAKTKKDSKLLDSLRVKGSLQFLALKTLNRFDKYRCREAKERLISAKQKVDCFHLQLQNMLYEVMHLQKECKTCLSFRSKDESINLVPLDQFNSEADEDLKEKATDSHSTHLARLEWELRQRQHLEEQLKSAEEVKRTSEEEIVVKRETLDKLQPILKSIVDATQPLYSELELPLQANDATHALAQYLSRPLYVLYVQLISYKHANRSAFSVQINGSLEDVKTFELSSKVEEEEEKEEQEDEEVQSRKSKKSRHRKSISHSNKTSLLNKLISCHPLSIELSFTSNQTQLNCVFSYLLKLEIICIKVNVKHNQSLHHFEALNETVLSHLLSNTDDGLKTPNPANDHTIKGYGIQDFSSLTPKIGFVYDWCQRLSGLDFITSNAKNISTSLSINSMDQTIKAITARFESRIALQRQLCDLDRNIIELPKELALEGCPQALCQIKELKELNGEEFRTISRLNDDIIMDSLDLDNSFIYRLLLSRGSASLVALIVIPLDYPKKTPFFHLSFGTQSERKNSIDSSLRELEQLVNSWCPHNCLPSCLTALLSLQIYRLKLGFDVYLESNQFISCDTEGPKEFPQKKVMDRLVTGRDHCIPFHYDSEHNVFTA